MIIKKSEMEQAMKINPPKPLCKKLYMGYIGKNTNVEDDKLLQSMLNSRKEYLNNIYPNLEFYIDNEDDSIGYKEK